MIRRAQKALAVKRALLGAGALVEATLTGGDEGAVRYLVQVREGDGALLVPGYDAPSAAGSRPGARHLSMTSSSLPTSPRSMTPPAGVCETISTGAARTA